jgi:hypothetical protein
MAVKTKAQLQTDISALGATYNETAIETVLDDMVDSYENVFAQVTTAQRNALTPTAGLIVYNTDNDRYEYWNGTVWFGIGQDVSTPIVVEINLSSAQILALDATPVTVATAPGAGFAVVPHSMTYRFTYGTVQYADGSTVALKSSTKTNSDPYCVIATQVMYAAANRSGVIQSATGTGIDAIVENDSIELKTTAAFTAGDGTLTVWVTYSVIPY